MSYIKFDGFVENYDTSKAKFGPNLTFLVKNTIMQIIHRYKDPDPAERISSYIVDIKFPSGTFTPSWRVNLEGKIYTNSDAIANDLIRDTKDPLENIEGFGLSQTFAYHGDTFQVYVNFREPIIE